MRRGGGEGIYSPFEGESRRRRQGVKKNFLLLHAIYMNKAWLLWIVSIGFVFFIARDANAVLPTQSPSPAGQAFLNQYCITCHQDQPSNTTGLFLDKLNLDRVGPDAAIWERVVRKIRTGMMPPSGARRPERAVLDAFAAELEGRLDREAAQNPNPGTPALYRLNRTEYANAIHDLLALDIDVATLLPADDSNEGFDNIADALGVSPSLIQGYALAAMKISRQAVGDRTLAPSQVTYQAPPGLAQDRHIEGLPLGTRGGMLIRHTFPLDAEYQIGTGGARGGLAAGVDITVDGVQVPVARGGRIPVRAGPHTIGVAMLDQRRAGGVDEQYSDFRNNAAFPVAGGVQSIVITGPFNAAGPGETPSRKRVFVCYPAGPQEETACARQILTALARRAFRRPPTDREIQTLLQFFNEGRADGDFETGVQHALARILISPRFLFRTEEEPDSVRAGQAYRVSDLALASRLSFFLWSSIPDDELLDAAIQGKLSDPRVLEQQTRRMLQDPKSEALTKNFAGQWLFLRELATVQPDTKEFDENLRQAMRRETELLFDSIVREDRPLVELLDANYTFLNERLARHYGVPNIRGDYFRRVSLDANSPRRGLLGHASILTVTSIANRTSPVSRGKWILQTVLGTPPPAPPPGVETNLDADPKAAKPRSLRERLEMHRTNPVCASCHKIMDPLGFALENFDLIGKWREMDGAVPINASGTLVDGTPVSGPADVRKAILDRSDSFITAATEKLLMYALGRAVGYYDMPTVRSIVREAGKNEHRFSSLVLGVVKSAPFQMKVKKS